VPAGEDNSGSVVVWERVTVAGGVNLCVNFCVPRVLKVKRTHLRFKCGLSYKYLFYWFYVVKAATKCACHMETSVTSLLTLSSPRRRRGCALLADGSTGNVPPSKVRTRHLNVPLRIARQRAGLGLARIQGAAVREGKKRGRK
jgi:hypothetical protein